MTDYLHKSFSVSMGKNDAYRDNFDKVFGKARQLDAIEQGQEELNALRVELAMQEAAIQELKVRINRREGELLALKLAGQTT